MFELPELSIAVYGFAAVLAAFGVRGVIRMVDNHIRKTPNNIDDKIWNSVRGAIREAVDEVDEDPELRR
jgi:hypothetical protein|tara:strand:- start:702 stop:908 length:207 start_codon:yes stop_codon:yes gene_type:complete